MPTMKIYAVVTLVGLVLSALAPARADEPKLPPRIAEILGWLPEDTETLFVAQGPFRHDVGMLGELLRDQVSWELRGQETLRGCEIALAVEGSRRSRPTDQGVISYEGAHIVVFQEPLGAAGDAFRTDFIEDARRDLKRRKSFEEDFGGKQPGVEFATTEKIGGHEVAIVRTESLQHDGSTSYVVQPVPDVLIIATDRSYLVEVLGRIRRKGKVRALPASLPEWKDLDPTLPFWAIRHYAKWAAPTDPSLPAGGTVDHFRIGLVFMYDAEKSHVARVKFLSTKKDIIEFAKAIWLRPDDNLKPEIQSTSPEIVDVTYTNPTAGSGCHVFFSMLVALLGHAF